MYCSKIHRSPWDTEETIHVVTKINQGKIFSVCLLEQYRV
jgi:hypothetical protein